MKVITSFPSKWRIYMALLTLIDVPALSVTTLIGEPISESIETSGAKLHQRGSRGKGGYQLGALVVIARRRSSLFRTPAGEPIDENVKKYWLRT